MGNNTLKITKNLTFQGKNNGGIGSKSFEKISFDAKTNTISFKDTSFLAKNEFSLSAPLSSFRFIDCIFNLDYINIWDANDVIFSNCTFYCDDISVYANSLRFEGISCSGATFSIKDRLDIISSEFSSTSFINAGSLNIADSAFGRSYSMQGL